MVICLAASGFAQSSSQFDTLLHEGFALHRQARFSEAIPLLERARQLEPNDYFANLLLGIDLLRTGKPEAAIPRLQLAARVRPTEEIPEGYLGEAMTAMGRYADAAAHYRSAVERSHGSESSLEEWAGFALERFHQVGEQLRASTPGIAAVRRLQATAARPGAALVCSASIAALERSFAAATTAASSANAGYHLSVCYAAEAGKAAAQLQNNAQDAAAVHTLRGDVQLRLKGDAAAAQQEYRQAIALSPPDPSLQERLAEALLAAGDSDGAKQAAEAALAIDPHRRGAMRTLAELAMANRDYEAALPRLQQLAAESPGDRTVQVLMGRALAQTGQPEEAWKHLAPALAAGYPDEKGALHALEARVLRQLGRDAEAEKASAEARRLSDAFQAHNKNPQHESSDGIE